MAGLRTEFEFTLPKGYVGDDGNLHRTGVMRLATARDEIEPLRDRSIDGPDDPYLTILVLARVITQLGSLESIGVREVEGLFAADLAFLQDLYGIINFGDQDDVEALQASVMPVSEASFDGGNDLDAADSGGLDAADVGSADGGIGAAEVEAETVDVEAVEVVDVPSTPRSPSSSRRRQSRIEEVPRAASQ
jgi:hypothetical protein